MRQPSKRRCRGVYVLKYTFSSEQDKEFTTPFFAVDRYLPANQMGLLYSRLLHGLTLIPAVQPLKFGMDKEFHLAL